MRVAFVTDIHLNATPAGWQQQPRWCEGIHAILDALAQRLAELHIDLLIYGGDLVETGSRDAIEQAAISLARIPTPAIVCLGNHDLTEPDSLACWRDAMRHWPQAQLADARLQFPELDVFALNNAWLSSTGEPSFRWDRQYPNPALLPDQIQQLETWLAADRSRPAILVLHAPIHPLPPELTGASAPSEIVPDAYSAPLRELLARHPRIRILLAGHCHAACATNHQPHAGQIHLTATSLTEVPYQFPVLELAGGQLRLTTHTLQPQPAGPQFNPDKPWVIGRASDRSIAAPLHF